LLQHLSTRENESNLCQNLLTVEHSDLKAQALDYANKVLKNFCKLAKRTKRRRNYQKQVLALIEHCLGDSRINLIPE